MNLSLSYDYSGVKEITTRGGASLSNSFYSKPPNWGDLPAWQLAEVGDDFTNFTPLSRSGRRIWDLSFSYLDDGDVFGSNQHFGGMWEIQDASLYDDGDLNASNLLDKTILTDDNFYSQVIHKTNGGQLPFIFQPNKDDNTNFAIAKFDQNSFTLQQTAPNLYSVKCRIKEVW